MPYTRTGPFVNGSSPGLSAQFFNNLENVLAQPSGGTETGKYYLEFGIGAINYYMSSYINTKSQTSTPVSVMIDTSTIGATGCNAPATALLDAYGFEVKASATGNVSDARVGGLWTVTY